LKSPTRAKRRLRGASVNPQRGVKEKDRQKSGGLDKERLHRKGDKLGGNETNIHGGKRGNEGRTVVTELLLIHLSRWV